MHGTRLRGNKTLGCRRRPRGIPAWIEHTSQPNRPCLLVRRCSTTPHADMNYPQARIQECCNGLDHGRMILSIVGGDMQSDTALTASCAACPHIPAGPALQQQPLRAETKTLIKAFEGSAKLLCGIFAPNYGRANGTHAAVLSATPSQSIDPSHKSQRMLGIERRRYSCSTGTHVPTTSRSLPLHRRLFNNGQNRSRVTLWWRQSPQPAGELVACAAVR
jgi:hypothetical protein